jgi:hypothetical protein
VATDRLPKRRETNAPHFHYLVGKATKDAPPVQMRRRLHTIGK